MGDEAEGSGDSGRVRGAGRMRLHVTSHPVADRGGRLSRVLVRPLRNTWAYASTHRIGEFRSNRADLLRLGALVRVAAASPHSAIHIPLPDLAEPNWAGQPPLALLVAREDTGLRASDWPRIRERTRRGPVPGRPTTVTAPPPRDPWATPAERDRLLERCPARLTQHAGTMILLGRPEVLFSIGDCFTDAGERVAGDRNVHKHGEAWMTDLFGVVEAGFGAPRRALQDTEFMIYAVEPIFHRARWQRLAAQRSAIGGRKAAPSENPMA